MKMTLFITKPEDYDVIICPNEDCEMKFIYYALWQREDESYTTIAQQSANYCPYCGIKIEWEEQ